MIRRFSSAPIYSTDSGDAAQGGPQGGGSAQARSSIKETFISIIISFAMAFVFRGFVVEAFLIPTGSMAPTLLGAHMRFQSPESGISWAANYQQHSPGTSNPVRVQDRVIVEDPVTGVRTERSGVPLRWGDRIFVMKYLAGVYMPRRWDSVVFKNPTDPTINYIKRLIGLPGEQVALFDGDVFIRTPRADDPKDANPWSLDGWRTARKPETAQRAMWQLVFDSAYTPLKWDRDGRTIFRPPWVGVEENAKSWEAKADGKYVFTGSGLARLEWDSRSRPIEDSYWYNVTREAHRENGRFPVSDLRIRGAVHGLSGLKSASCVIQTRGAQFRAVVDGGRASIQTRDRTRGATDQWEAWRTLAESPCDASGRSVTTIDFWHADQELQLWINDRLLARAEYNWSLRERVERSMGEVGSSLDLVSSGDATFTRESNYVKPRVWWEFDGGPATLERVTLWRDIYYQPDLYDALDARTLHPKRGEPALATHPRSTLTLTKDQYFVCGDNSPASLDARKWGPPHPWVAEIDPTMGVVHRDLMIGKAFFVYFPAPYRVYGLPVPDVGRMRWIW